MQMNSNISLLINQCHILYISDNHSIKVSHIFLLVYIKSFQLAYSVLPSVVKIVRTESQIVKSSTLKKNNDK